METSDKEDQVNKVDYTPDESGFDPRDTNKDGKVGPIERRAAEGGKVAKFINKALDTQDENAARATLGQGFGGTVETNSHLATNDDAAKAAIAKEVARTNAGNNPTPEKQKQLDKLDKANEEKLKEFTQTTAGVDDSSVDNNRTEDTNVSSTNAEQTKEEAKKDPATRYKMKSILQAYNDGDIDANTRDYMILDTFSNFARNMGKDIGNVAAAYSGGTVDNERGTSMWDKRNQAMAQSAIESEQSGVEGSREKRAADQQAANLYATKLNNMNMADRRALAEKVKAMAEDAPEPLKLAAYSLANNMLTGQTMSAYDMVGTGVTDILARLLTGL